MEFVTYFLGDGASRDDGDRIIGRAEVGQGNQPGNAEFRAAPAADMGRNFSDNIRDASVETDDGQYAAGQQSDDDQFSHAGHAAAHGLEPGHEGEIPHADANQSRCKEPHGQNGHDVDSGQGRHQHEQIGKYFHPFNGDIRCGGGLHVPSEQDVAGQGQQSGGERHLYVGPEFVPHGAALRTGGGDRGV